MSSTIRAKSRHISYEHKSVYDLDTSYRYTLLANMPGNIQPQELLFRNIIQHPQINHF
jgi:hypothetical protein